MQKISRMFYPNTRRKYNIKTRKIFVAVAILNKIKT
jgi:hypothetical protein